MNKTTFEEELERIGKIVYTNVGDSMMPLLREKQDLVIIKKVEQPLKKYDVPLYRRDSGQYVLHRILKVRKQDYVICGDNRYQKEIGITQKHIIGVLDGIVRDGKELSVSDWRYRLYVHLWCDFFWVRAIFLIAKQGKRKILSYWRKRKQSN